MDNVEVKKLEKFALEIRLNTVKSLNHLGSGHYGGSLSIVECLAVLYGKVMKIDPKNPDWEGRDYFILSKGHAGPGLYPALALLGYFELDKLMTLNKDGTTLPNHLDRMLTPGVDMSSGSLGQGISVATGVAKALKMNGSDQYVYCIVGDGEMNEGQCWEAVQFATAQDLDNLILFIDDNKKQLDGTVEEIGGKRDFAAIFATFGFDSAAVAGNDVSAIYNAITDAKKVKGKPHVIVLDTIKGQGFPYLEQKASSHHLRPNEEEKVILNNFIAKLEKELEGLNNA
ncbi:MAG: transketolase [Defluviitaleaceae bacterium]|nr:transketolase [Defluviitaleaceae bacterium]